MTKNALIVLLLEVSAVWGSLLSWHVVNAFLQFLILLCGAISAIIGVYRLWKTNRMTKEKTREQQEKENPGN